MRTRELPRDATHPDHALYGEAVAGVRAEDARLGRESDDASRRMAASLLLLAVTHRFERIDAVTLSCKGDAAHPGEYAFIVQGAVDDPAHLRAEIPTVEALREAPEASFRALDVLNQRRVQEAVRRERQDRT